MTTGTDALEAGVKCERCGVDSSAPPSLAWLGRHAHGTPTVSYRAFWLTRESA